jgi:hypothetical protein
VSRAPSGRGRTHQHELKNVTEAFVSGRVQKRNWTQEVLVLLPLPHVCLRVRGIRRTDYVRLPVAVASPKASSFPPQPSGRWGGALAADG